MDLYVSPAVASVVRICIDQYNDSDWSGRIYTRLNIEPIQFRNIGEMLGALGKIWNTIGYPQESTINRNFAKQQILREKKKNMNVSYLEEGTKDKIKVELSEADMDKKRGKQDTFIVRIQYRQNATWQGHVTWVDENRTVPFRSVLELIKLLDSTQNDEADEWKKEA